MTVSLSRTSPADMATACDNPHMGGTMLTPWPEDPGQQESGADGSAAKRGKFPKLFGCLAVLALASLGWAGWKALSVKQAREEAAAAAAPKAAVTCPFCGATTTPDASGCCEFCGGAVNG